MLHDFAQRLRKEMDVFVQALRQEISDAKSLFQNALQEQRSSLLQEVKARNTATSASTWFTAEASSRDDAGRPSFLSRTSTASLYHDSNYRQPEPGQRPDAEPGAAARAAAEGAPQQQQLNALREGLAATEQELLRLASQIAGQTDGAFPRSDVEVLRTEVSSLTAKTGQMQQETASFRRELARLTELTMGCLGKVKEMPSELENLRQDMHALQAIQSRGSSTSMSGSEDQQELSKAMSLIKVEIFRAKELFARGQRSAGVVLADLEILKQDLHTLKEKSNLGTEKLHQLKLALRQELTQDLKCLVQTSPLE